MKKYLAILGCALPLAAGCGPSGAKGAVAKQQKEAYSRINQAMADAKLEYDDSIVKFSGFDCTSGCKERVYFTADDCSILVMDRKDGISAYSTNILSHKGIKIGKGILNKGKEYAGKIVNTVDAMTDENKKVWSSSQWDNIKDVAGNIVKGAGSRTAAEVMPADISKAEQWRVAVEPRLKEAISGYNIKDGVKTYIGNVSGKDGLAAFLAYSDGDIVAALREGHTTPEPCTMSILAHKDIRMPAQSAPAQRGPVPGQGRIKNPLSEIHRSLGEIKRVWDQSE